MALVDRMRGWLLKSAVDWRVRQIEDPVERLRYLRRNVGERRRWVIDGFGGRGVWAKHKGKIIAVAAALLAWPVVEATRGSEHVFARVETIEPVTVRPEDGFANVWRLEDQAQAEIWSNGLRIERQFEVANEPRSFEAYLVGEETEKSPVKMSTPVGIVFHTTESHLAPLEEEQAKRLKSIGKSILQLVREKRSYHYLIDRFGRVWRVVKETDAANHAGNSVWADEQYSYLNLNRSFLGVSVETQMGQQGNGAPATDAQLRSLKILTEMLRAKYKIQAGNCVAHAQVSVNPSNRQVGYHYDWGAGFPFRDVGLPDNYLTPMPAIWLFGFTYDPSLVKLTDAKYWEGLVRGEQKLRDRATARGVSPVAYKKHLEARYRKVFDRFRSKMELSAEKGKGEPEGSEE